VLLCKVRCVWRKSGICHCWHLFTAILTVRSAIVSFPSPSVRLLVSAVCCVWGFFGLRAAMSVMLVLLFLGRVRRISLGGDFFMFPIRGRVIGKFVQSFSPRRVFRCILSRWLMIGFCDYGVCFPLCVRITISIVAYPDLVLAVGYAVSNPPAALSNCSRASIASLFAVYFYFSVGVGLQAVCAIFSVVFFLRVHVRGDMSYGSGSLIFVYVVVALLTFPCFLTDVAPYCVVVGIFVVLRCSESIGRGFYQSPHRFWCFYMG